jgi:hypothetical protein
MDQLTEVAMKAVMVLIERNLVPDFLIRPGIRHLLAMRLREVRRCVFACKPRWDPTDRSMFEMHLL